MEPLLKGEADERHRALVGEVRWTVLDIGLGDQPDTTVELFDLLGPTVVGIDADSSRVDRAQPFVRPGLSFAHVETERPPHSGEGARRAGGGSHLGLPCSSPHLIRAMNVLRGNTIEEAQAETGLWCSWLADGGLLIEGSTDADGALGSAHLWRKRGTQILHEGLHLFTDFTRGFAPLMFRDVLPRDLRRSVKLGQPIHDFLHRWQRAFESAREPGESPAAGFARSLAAMSDVRRAGPNALTWIAPIV